MLVTPGCDTLTLTQSHLVPSAKPHSCIDAAMKLLRRIASVYQIEVAVARTMLQAPG